MNETFIPASDYKKKKWFLIDCNNKKLGKIASSIIKILSGKAKSCYYPSIDNGDYVILINAETLIANRYIERLYVFRPGHLGSGLKKIVNGNPQQIIENSVFGMMPNGIVKRRLANRLKIYQGPKHPHIAQKPIYIKDIENFVIHN